jgi:hypothetical protein
MTVLDRQMVLCVALSGGIHVAPVVSLACLENARLERCQECQRREEESLILFRAYSHSDSRAGSVENLRCSAMRLTPSGHDGLRREVRTVGTLDSRMSSGSEMGGFWALCSGN